MGKTPAAPKCPFWIAPHIQTLGLKMAARSSKDSSRALQLRKNTFDVNALPRVMYLMHH
jgi:hypothetical protein